MRIILDGMGGDHAPASVVEGAVLASKQIEHEIHIIGQEELIHAELAKYKYDAGKIFVIDAREVITNDDLYNKVSENLQTKLYRTWNDSAEDIAKVILETIEKKKKEQLDEQK